ncbi:MAG TPA: alpha/beta hydrolase-fold protein [Candidatus Eisenbacteria bacterium]|nr:alpha/beta hydrolase-fold protein [Candidatus Eisenbacteria bacterium]
MSVLVLVCLMVVAATGSAGVPSPEEKQLARQVYPTRALYDLWEASLDDPNAVQAFATERRRHGPLIDSIAGNPSEMQVTFVCLGTDSTRSAELVGGPDFMGLAMTRLGRTRLFFATQVVPTDARFVYAFNLTQVRRTGAGGVETTEEIHTVDALLEMPNAPAQPYITPRAGVRKGKVVQTTIKSALLNEERKISIYVPAAYEAKTACNLLVVFDGGIFGGNPDTAQVEIPTPTILDNLIADGKLGPTIAVMVWSMGKRNRDLPGSKPFADFIATEVVPWARSRYTILPGPKNVAVAGSSLGGFCSSYCAFTHPGTIGNVVSLSGSYWVSKTWQTVDADFTHRLYPRETGLLIEAFKASPRLPIRFYMDIGIYDMGAALLGTNRELRDVLQLKGYDVDYREFAGGHNSENWRGSIADGLISVLGRKQR